MLIEKHELTMSQLGLGHLTEFDLMVMFGNAHSHHLVQDLDITPEGIRDAAGLLLYPAYFCTHLKVPPHRTLGRFGPWSHVDVGTDVKRFGDTVLESRYLFGSDGEVPADPALWGEADLVSMYGSNLIVVDATEEGSARKVSVPKPGCIASLDKLRRPPAAIGRARKVRGAGFDLPGDGFLYLEEPFRYKLLPHRDASPGHAMIFAMFTRLMDYAEFHLLSEVLRPALPHAVLHHLEVLDRETFYYGNAFAGDEVAVTVVGDLELAEPDFHGEALDIVSAGKLTFNIEVTNARGGALLALAHVEKLLALPTSLQDLTQDVRRFYTAHYEA